MTATPTGGAASTDAETDILAWLAVMPFLGVREMEALSGWSHTAVYRAHKRMEQRGLVATVHVSVPGAATVRRSFLTSSGVRAAAAARGVSPESLLRSHPLSAHWLRLLAARLDAVAPVYRLVAELCGVTGIRGFSWYRKLPLDGLIELEGGRILGIMREGRSAPPSHLGRRLRALLFRRHPDTLAVLVPDLLRLRDWTRLLDRLPYTAFLALEEDVLAGNIGAAIWHVPSDPSPWNLQRAIGLANGGSIPRERPLVRVHLPPGDIQRAVHALADGKLRGRGADSLLPLAIDSGGKRILDMIALWPWIDLMDMKDILGVSKVRVLEMLDRPLRLGLAVRVRHDGRVRYVLGDRGLAFLARRDRVAISAVQRRWGAAPLESETLHSWRSVSGTTSRRLIRDISHTSSVHHFLAAMSRQARETGGRLVQSEPPHRSARRYYADGRQTSLNPDAYGRYQAGGGTHHFFLEWERRGAHPYQLRARLTPYLRYYQRAGQPLNDYGACPVLMVVLRDEVVESLFLRINRTESARAGAEALRVLASHPRALDATGPLGRAWGEIPGGARLAPW